jgi:2-polyprenyl-3-methyl-5-hydroxy-6-metoxy-1,4-benzoquinol methylase
MNIVEGIDDAAGEKQLKDPKVLHAMRWSFLRRQPAILDLIRPLFEPPQRLIQPYVKKGQVVADLACAWGYYTFPLADLVGPEGKVYAVDLGEKCIRAIQKKADNGGYHNIEAHASSASDVSFIKDGSVDFVLAYGLLCSMENDRQLAVNEIKRILKSSGQAYISLGFPPPLGLVDQEEWDKILEGFRVERGGNFKELWALVTVKQGAV